MLDPDEKDKAGLPLTARAVSRMLLAALHFPWSLLAGFHRGTR